MELKIQSFLKAFNISSASNYRAFLTYIKSNLRYLQHSETQLTAEIQNKVPKDEVRKCQRLLLSILSNQCQHKAEMLYTLQRLNKQPQILPDAFLVEAYTEKVPQTLQEVVINNIQPVQLPSEKLTQGQLIKCLVFALQGIDNEDFKLSVSQLTGLLEISSSLLTVTQQSMIIEISDCCGILQRLRQLLASLQQSHSKLKLAFAEYMSSFLSNEFGQFLLKVQQCQSLKYFLVEVRQNLRPQLLQLASIAEKMVQKMSFEEFMRIANESQITSLQVVIFKPISEFILSYAQFGEFLDVNGDFFLENQKSSNPYYSVAVLSSNQLIQQYHKIGLNVKFLRQICKNLDFDLMNSPEFFGLKHEEVVNEEKLARAADQILHFTNSAVFDEIQKADIASYILMIKQVFLGENAEFLTQFAELQRRNLGDKLVQVYLLQAVNQLDQIFESSMSAQKQEFLAQVVPQITQNSCQFSLALKPESPFNCVFEAEGCAKLTRFFNLLLLIRISQILINQRVRVGLLSVVLFKFQALLTIVSTYFQQQIEQCYAAFRDCLLTEQQNEIPAISNQFAQLVGQLEEISFGGKFYLFIGQLYALCNQLTQLKVNCGKAQLKKQIESISGSVREQIQKLAQALQAQKGEHEEQFLLLAEQLLNCGF